MLFSFFSIIRLICSFHYIIHLQVKCYFIIYFNFNYVKWFLELLYIDFDYVFNDIIKYLKNNDIDSIITNSEIQQEDFNLETERILTPKENNEESTIELVNYRDHICWSNNNGI